MKITLAIAVLLYGVAAVRIKSRHDREPPPVAREAVECIIDGAAEIGEEIGGKEAVKAAYYCYCMEVDAEDEEHCGYLYECFPEGFDSTELCELDIEDGPDNDEKCEHHPGLRWEDIN